ncbi:MAG: SigB/SigF/SigG family RNA polymerase sigma factor [Oscillospiraceae bacterium]|nr:SigB/SigF/SigG family RNA polymerase sigma factor [Oscillospiraceae bacterium]
MDQNSIVHNIIEAQNGNEEEMANLVKCNNGLIWSIVKRFKDRGHELEDLYQIGCIGFIKSIKRFDIHYEVKLSTYAVPYILGEIKRFIRDDGQIKVSRSTKELIIKIKVIQKQYLDKKGKEISIIDIAKELKIDKEEIAFALASTRPIESINEEIYEENGKAKLIDQISSGKDEETTIVNNLVLKNLINALNERERKIILLRYFKEQTQSQVAKILGVTQVQVSRIEKRILGEMRGKMEKDCICRGEHCSSETRGI